MKKAHIEYPCNWIYKVITSDEGALRTTIADFMGDNKYSLSLSRKSAGGKYSTLTMEVPVKTENRRNEIYIKLNECKSVKTVL